MTATVENFGQLQSGEVCDLTGVTIRQLDYWVRVGIIRPDATLDGRGYPSEGPGSRRWWKRSQMPVIRALATVSDAVTSSGTVGPCRLMRVIGHSSHPRGPWIMEQDGIRITVQVIS